jgi:hypothetical protein
VAAIRKHEECCGKRGKAASSHLNILGLGKSREGGLFLELETFLQARPEHRLLSLVEHEASPERAIKGLGAALVTSLCGSREPRRSAINTVLRRLATKPLPTVG